ncbi:MAG: HD domain-containing protein [Polyangiaceae bacterium]
MGEIVTSTEADAKRALLALEWAVERAEKGIAEPAPVPTRADFKVAAEKYLFDVRSRLDRVMMSPDAEAGLDALLESGALAAFLPEVEAMVGFGDGEWRHKDVWKHTKQVVRQAVPKLEVRWAALLHDIGKIKTRSISPTGEVHFFGHAEVGARMFDKLDRRVPLFTRDEALKSTVRFLILHHLRASQYEASWTDSAVRRFTKEMGEALDDVLNLSRADITTKRPEKKRKGLRQISDLAERVRCVSTEDARVPPLPSGIGDAMMVAFALPPSRKIGEMKKMLEAAVEQGEIAERQEAEAYLEFIRQNRERFGL